MSFLGCKLLAFRRREQKWVLFTMPSMPIRLSEECLGSLTKGRCPPSSTGELIPWKGSFESKTRRPSLEIESDFHGRWSPEDIPKSRQERGVAPCCPSSKKRQCRSTHVGARVRCTLLLGKDRCTTMIVCLFLFCCGVVPGVLSSATTSKSNQHMVSRSGTLGPGRRHCL